MVEGAEEPRDKADVGAGRMGGWPGVLRRGVEEEIPFCDADDGAGGSFGCVVDGGRVVGENTFMRGDVES